MGFHFAPLHLLFQVKSFALSKHLEIYFLLFPTQYIVAVIPLVTMCFSL